MANASSSVTRPNTRSRGRPRGRRGATRPNTRLTGTRGEGTTGDNHSSSESETPRERGVDNTCQRCAYNYDLRNFDPCDKADWTNEEKCTYCKARGEPCLKLPDDPEVMSKYRKLVRAYRRRRADSAKALNDDDTATLRNQFWGALGKCRRKENQREGNPQKESSLVTQLTRLGDIQGAMMGTHQEILNTLRLRWNIPAPPPPTASAPPAPPAPPTDSAPPAASVSPAALGSESEYNDNDFQGFLD